VRQKRKEVAASVPSRITRVPVGVPARRNAVAEVVRGGIWSRISSRAAPSKRERGESERGPSPGRASAVTRRRARRAKRRRHVDPSPFKRQKIGRGPGWRESAIHRSQLRPKGGAAVAGPGQPCKSGLATGSYEGSLTMEGIPGSHEPSSSRFDGHGGLGGFLTVPSTGNHRSRRHGGALTPRTEHARRSVSRGSKRKRRQGCQRLGRIGTVGRQRPRSRSPSGNGKNARLACSPVRELFVSNLDPPKRGERCEALPSPVKSRGSQSPRGIHARESGGAIRERTRCGCTQLRQGGRSRSDAFRVLPTVRVARLGGGTSRALSQKEARSTV